MLSFESPVAVCQVGGRGVGVLDKYRCIDVCLLETGPPRDKFPGVAYLGEENENHRHLLLKPPSVCNGNRVNPALSFTPYLNISSSAYCL